MTSPAEDRHPALGGFERVLIELDWWDGPRSGLADVDGKLHYFRAVHDYRHSDEPDDDDDYFVWPASEAALALEREQWEIFVEWNTRYEAGTATVDDHPAHEGVSARYDELTALLATHRATPPGARRLAADWHARWQPASLANRYHLDGPNYLVRWRSPQPVPPAT